MSSRRWLIVGISGSTCSGKTLLASRLNAEFKNSIIICQDDYFLPKDDQRHVLIPELNHPNYELMTSLDMEQMRLDVQTTLQSPPKAESLKETNGRPILIIEGFVIFKCKTISSLCDLKYFLTLPRETCRERREIRLYDPPDVPGYFDKAVWPEYVEYETEVKKDKDLCKTIVFIDGSESKEEIYQKVSTEIKKRLA